MAAFIRHDENLMQSLKRLLGRPSIDNTGAGGGTYSIPGMEGTYQNQPGLSDNNQDAGGRWHSQNVYNRPDVAKIVQDEWAKIQQDYPQYANHADVRMLTTDQIHKLMGPKYNAMAFGGNGSDRGVGSPGHITINSDSVNNHETARALLLKELGQVMSNRMLGSPQSADRLLQLQGFNPDVFAHDELYPSGLSGGGPKMWNGDTSHMGPHQIDVGGYKSFPEDTYGIAFSRLLGSNLGKSKDNSGIPSGRNLAEAQAYGMLPTPVDHSPKAQLAAMLQRNQAQNLASQAMHGVKSARYS